MVYTSIFAACELSLVGVRAEPSRQDAQALLRDERCEYVDISRVQKGGFANPGADVDRAKGGIANSVVARK